MYLIPQRWFDLAERGGPDRLRQLRHEIDQAESKRTADAIFRELVHRNSPRRFPSLLARIESDEYREFIDRFLEANRLYSEPFSPRISPRSVSEALS